MNTNKNGDKDITRTLVYSNQTSMKPHSCGQWYGVSITGFWRADVGS